MPIVLIVSPHSVVALIVMLPFKKSWFPVLFNIKILFAVWFWLPGFNVANVMFPGPRLNPVKGFTVIFLVLFSALNPSASEIVALITHSPSSSNHHKSTWHEKFALFPDAAVSLKHVVLILESSLGLKKLTFANGLRFETPLASSTVKFIVTLILPASFNVIAGPSETVRLII